MVEIPQTHRAVRWYPPSYKIRVEDVPVPTIENPDDAIVKVTLGGLCGSDLHVYRGTGGIHDPIVCGHEFVGEVVALGDNFGPNAAGRPTLYSTLNIGDKVVAPFTVSCGECHFCRIGFSSRCAHSQLFGIPSLSGGQAQYVRVPKAGGTLFKVDSILALLPPDKERKLSDSSLLLLADILPTGVFAAVQALQHPKVAPFLTGRPFPFNATFVPEIHESTKPGNLHSSDRKLSIAIVGLGPVGLCATVALLDMLSDLNVSTGLKAQVLAIDPFESRQAKLKTVFETVSRGGSAQGVEFVSAGIEDGKEIMKKWTDDVGADVVLEVVGNNSALKLSYDLIRPFGVITSVGVHPDETVPFTGTELYDKNVSFDFGRCPVRSVLPFASKLLLKRQDVFGGVGTPESLIDRIVSIEEAEKSYELFDKGKVGKVLFNPWI
ncbi:alcohol dehydrogenase [Abortiporus biennis]|nr:alcohol dehydrogenase [Abortiporus biennis]